MSERPAAGTPPSKSERGQEPSLATATKEVVPARSALARRAESGEA